MPWSKAVKYGELSSKLVRNGIQIVGTVYSSINPYYWIDDHLLLKTNYQLEFRSLSAQMNPLCNMPQRLLVGTV